jgi:DNA invertase Pin-like site-specific DNA recombinase
MSNANATAVDEYFQALERLKKGQPKKVSKGSFINNDTVALEAGRGRGSLKKSRPGFAKLIMEIEKARLEQKEPERLRQDKLDRLGSDKEEMAQMYNEALKRNLSLLHEVYLLKQEKLPPDHSSRDKAKVTRLRR